MTTLPILSEGSTGPDVRWAQYLLVRRTMSYDEVDGEFGPVTDKAVRQFQRDSDLDDDGTIGPLTWAALGGERERPPTLKRGSQGAVVGKLQTALNNGRGDFAPDTNPVLAVDGIFGPITESAVEGTQRFNHIDADGIVGMQTWAVPIHAAGQVIANLCGVLGPG
jgi:peptidoglycan hydrolase-like protein with peptidoglycan-binding domain